MQAPYNVLFLCTGNSARSILAESVLGIHGRGQFKAYSAGSQPVGSVNPFALALLKEQGVDTQHLRSKSWHEFVIPRAPIMDFVFTVCDQAAREVCPDWPGNPITANWALPDPAKAEGDPHIQMAAFRETFEILSRRIAVFVKMSTATLDRLSLKWSADRGERVLDSVTNR